MCKIFLTIIISIMEISWAIVNGHTIIPFINTFICYVMCIVKFSSHMAIFLSGNWKKKICILFIINILQLVKYHRWCCCQKSKPTSSLSSSLLFAWLITDCRYSSHYYIYFLYCTHTWKRTVYIPTIYYYTVV